MLSNGMNGCPEVIDQDDMELFLMTADQKLCDALNYAMVYFFSMIICQWTNSCPLDCSLPLMAASPHPHHRGCYLHILNIVRRRRKTQSVPRTHATRAVSLRHRPTRYSQLYPIAHGVSCPSNQISLCVSLIPHIYKKSLVLGPKRRGKNKEQWERVTDDDGPSFFESSICAQIAPATPNGINSGQSIATWQLT